ncbi:FecR family protein [Chitinophaga sp.]|uniref:FecR family protein n=1 Tax=Chitinophaga sp. TaxID=1869181 RepID=UPI002BCBB727|nr:FecR domain-containing protein [Chitinophaga sp.]HWV64214.1 FecR domain-containing protein [Chitinophaga sp.]
MDQKKQSLQEQVLKLLENKSTAKEAEEFLRLPPEMLDAFLDEQEWNELLPRKVPEEWSALWLENINRKRASRIRRLHWKYWSSAAAVLLLGIATTAYLFREYTFSHREITKNNAGVEKTLQRDTIIVNQGSAIRKYALPDQSVVQLSPGSTLRFDISMQVSRSLWLEGEGVFDVVHDSQRPFTVYTDGLVTTDLGTVFKITAYKGKRTAQVQLISGKVAVHSLQDTSKLVYLTAGQRCSFDMVEQSLQMMPQEHGELPVKSGMQKESLSEDKISFNSTPLPEVLQQLSKVYDTHIEFSLKALEARKFTGSFKKNAKLEGVIETLLLVNELKSNKVGDTIYISAK